LLERDKLGGLLDAEDKYFCSELVADSFVKAGISCFEKQPYQVMPAEFTDEAKFEFIAMKEMEDRGKLPKWLRVFFRFSGYSIAALI